MARKRYRRYRRSKGRWSANIQRIHMTGEAPSDQVFGDTLTIAQNPVQSATTVSQQYTVKNIEISGQLEAGLGTGGASSIEDVTYYIMYVPEGYPIDLNLPFAHPEWIMAYKYIGQAAQLNIADFTQPPKIKTRLSRRLNTGDSIIFLYTGINSTVTAGPVNIKFNGLVRWWTKAN
jgi:hypothetical protein